jgi:hypothetical protein
MGCAKVTTTAVNVWDGSTAKSFAGGTGTEDDPYLISTGAQLKYLQTLSTGYNDYNARSKHYALTQDINLNGLTWDPLGANNYFKSNFDGCDFTISNFRPVLRPYGSADNKAYVCGLFGYVMDGIIKNLNVNADISVGLPSVGTFWGVGGMAGTYTPDSNTGQSHSGAMENCHFTGSITVSGGSSATSTGGQLFIGGLVGQFVGASIVNCSNTANITCNGISAFEIRCGGIAGSGSVARNCYNTGNLSFKNITLYGTGTVIISGIVNVVSLNCYNTGDIDFSSTSTVTGSVDIAGVCINDDNYKGVINCFNKGAISVVSSSSGNVHVGGIVGRGGGETINCYNSNTVTVTASNASKMNTGAIVGEGYTVRNVYWQFGQASSSIPNQGNIVNSYTFDASGVVATKGGTLNAALNEWVEGQGYSDPAYLRWGGEPYPMFADITAEAGFANGAAAGALVSINGGTPSASAIVGVSGTSDMTATFNAGESNVMAYVFLNNLKLTINAGTAEPGSFTTFSGFCQYKAWYTDTTKQTVNVKVTAITANLELVGYTMPQSEMGAALYTIAYSYKAPDGSGTTVITEYAQANEEAEILPIGYTYPGYTQKGWTTTQGRSTVTHAFGATYTATDDLTLYPVWARDVGMVTLQYTGGVGPTNEFADLISSWYFSPEYEKTMQLPSAEYMTALSKAAGHDMTFAGWYTDEALADAIPLTSGKCLIPSNWTGDKVVYGKWS